MIQMRTCDVHMLEQSPKVLHGTLRKITERLASELAEPSATAPDWSESEWTIARAVAAMHGVSPLLSQRLRWSGPKPWANFLEQQRNHTSSRYTRIENLVRRLGERATQEGVAIIPLKGVALHSMGIYTSGERPMADVDILVQPEDAERTKQILESMAFYEANVTWKERLFVPCNGHSPASLGEHSDNDIKIELHDRICEMLPLRVTDVSRRVFPVSLRPGLNAYPSRASLMIHLLLHAAGAMAYQALRLMHVHDISLLAQRMTSEDWEDVLRSADGAQQSWWGFPPLRLTSLYYPCIPPYVLSSFEQRCPRLLALASRGKTLSDVSFSHLWVDAFPGIEWSRSPSEMLSYIVSRVRPSATHMAYRKAAAKMDMWASANRWTSMSQGRRIARWLMAKQARATTMYVVEAAFAQSS
jgi:Uncharacterised nucleotidyltransferase